MKKGQKNPRASRNWIRCDYRKYLAWTIAETADYSGVSIQRVEDWLCAGHIARANLAGPFKVNRESVERYLKTGQPQGNRMPGRFGK